MPHLLVYICTQEERWQDVLQAWKDAGVSGATILDSAGFRQVERGLLRDDLPLLPSLRDLIHDEEIPHHTIFSVIKRDEVLQRAIEATRRIVQDFAAAESGLLFVVPVAQVFGLKERGG